MGKRTFPGLAAVLIDKGLPADTPALIAEAVSTPEQTLSRSTVAELSRSLEQGISNNPALILYGPLADED